MYFWPGYSTKIEEDLPYYLNIFDDPSTKLQDMEVVLCKFEDVSGSPFYEFNVDFETNFTLVLGPADQNKDLSTLFSDYSESFFSLAFVRVLEDFEYFYPNDSSNKLFEYYMDESDEILNRMTDHVVEESTYSEYYRTRNTIDAEKELTVNDLTDGLKNNGQYGSPGCSNVRCNHQVLSPYEGYESDLINLNFGYFNLINITIPKPESMKFLTDNLIQKKKISYFNNQLNRTDVSHYDRMKQYGISLENHVFSTSIFGVKIDQLTNQTAITTSHQVNFDSNCIRLDFAEDLLRQSKRGEQNGLKMTLKFPKKIGDTFSPLIPVTLPRRKIKLSPVIQENSSKRRKKRSSSEITFEESTEYPEFTNNFYIMAYPKSLKFPTRESPEVDYIDLEANHNIDISMSKNKITYIHDPLVSNLTKLCQNEVNSLDQCLYEYQAKTLNCDPLNINSTETHTVCEYPTSPMNAIDPYASGCYPQKCQQDFIKFEKTIKHPLTSCDDNNLVNNQFFKEKIDACFGSPNYEYFQMYNMKETFYTECRNATINLEHANNKKTFKICDALGVASEDIFSYNEVSFKNDRMDDLYDTYSFTLGYESLFVSEVNEVFLDTFINTAIDTLGMTGFWMGFSFITMLEFITLFGIMLQACFKRRRADNKIGQIELETGGQAVLRSKFMDVSNDGWTQQPDV